MKWRKKETHREKIKCAQAEQIEEDARVQAANALAAERERFTLWCQEAEKTIRNNPGSEAAREAATQLLRAARCNREETLDPKLPAGPEIGWKTQDYLENSRRLSQATYHYIQSFFPGLYGIRQRLFDKQKVDPDSIAIVVDYLDAAPRFHGAGYLANDLIGFVRRAELNALQKKTLQSVIIRAIDSQRKFSIKKYARLARAVDSPELRSQFQARLEAEDPVVQRQAATILHSLTEKDAGR